MKLDVSLIHRILRQIEAGHDPWDVSDEPVHDSLSITEHTRVLIQHKLIECEDNAKKSIQGLTSEGSRFLKALRDDRARERIREKMKHLGEEVRSEIAMEIVKDALLEML